MKDQITKCQYDDVFVILTYKNTEDILELIDSLQNKVSNYKIIIVNSYYDDPTKETFRRISEENQCDFIPVKNKGYGYGNNIGIRYAIENYRFKRVVISNPDITIQKYDQHELDKYSDGVVGGIIINARGKNQNPLRIIDWNFTNYSPYYRYVKKNNALFYLSIVLAKLQRVKLLLNSEKTKVFSVHGSFFAISKSVLDKINPVFDENIFLFEEEIDIAKLFKNRKIPVYYSSSINVNHKEDGDVSKANLNNQKQMAKSLNYVMKKWKN